MSYLTGLAEIVLWVNDMAQSLHFYHELLGLTLISRPELPNKFLKVADGRAGIPQMIVLVPKSAEVKAKPAGWQLHHLAFELAPENFDAQQQALAAAGYTPRGGIHPVLASRTMYVDDPNGNEVEFICRELANG